MNKSFVVESVTEKETQSTAARDVKSTIIFVTGFMYLLFKSHTINIERETNYDTEIERAERGIIIKPMPYTPCLAQSERVFFPAFSVSMLDVLVSLLSFALLFIIIPAWN